MPRVLVTGAAGLIGRAVVARLLASGVPVTALILESGTVDGARVVVGDARDPEVVAGALDDVDAVIHLAAIPSPLADPAERVFAVNTQATFTVLDQAGRAGVRRVALASSYAIGGLPFAPHRLTMPYLPVDTALPLQIHDAYALSKRVDEETAAMMHRRYDMTVVALRLPFVGTADDRLATTAAHFRTTPEAGASDVWSYLDSRDAARALVSALSPARPGCHVLYVAAPETLAPDPTDDLLARFHPSTPRPSFPGRTVPIDLEPARELIGFTAEHPFPVGRSGGVMPG
ncbi:NAD(P)-dependent oxidoreductase [Actinoplanes sp. NBRC 103695]|uniref:NAD-dependent epimerase/dehydratase family protein n=1 Tax=Actinoplanes sp. NBRC 103695 TaxID=3032202 RepID=UPI0024A4F3CF|nr:NAD(P)-dependent oxidoreductase [Actinoplanes sp. NBRC 103695]GLY95945.1 NAD-dependent epimerase [Actinoplanes sp. NBRC 103695]